MTNSCENKKRLECNFVQLSTSNMPCRIPITQNIILISLVQLPKHYIIIDSLLSISREKHSAVSKCYRKVAHKFKSLPPDVQNDILKYRSNSRNAIHVRNFV